MDNVWMTMDDGDWMTVDDCIWITGILFGMTVDDGVWITGILFGMTVDDGVWITGILFGMTVDGAGWLTVVSFMISIYRLPSQTRSIPSFCKRLTTKNQKEALCMIFRIKVSRFRVISATLYDKSYKSLILGVATLSFCTIFHTTCLYSNGYTIILYEKSYNLCTLGWYFLNNEKPAGIFTDWPTFLLPLRPLDETLLCDITSSLIRSTL
ncbi:hypothetical protein A7K91_18365 [Paenibacillus oryzae]|uniref:Uncharacterized protein n=2 Tax=Paenibacillus oryzae TaxID=1844972 RepID=A0A1A5YKL8_9BACL|nr:hypothetical protein A7K91_18365 [Paenibacillus oryzae]